MANTLWTPNDGEVPIDKARQKQTMSAQEMEVFAALDSLSRKWGMCLVCLKCDKPFIGLNDGHSRTAGIHCGCRGIRADIGPGGFEARRFAGRGR